MHNLITGDETTTGVLCGTLSHPLKGSECRDQTGPHSIYFVTVIV